MADLNGNSNLGTAIPAVNAVKITQTMTKDCFSYIRYSSPNQIGNTSVDRQLEVAPRVAAAKRWTLRTDLAVLQEAVSSYKGLNVAMIRRIIQDVETGMIPKGTVMIIEKFNRAFRQHPEDSVPLLWELLKSGLELYIDQTDRHLTRKSLADENMEMTIALQELKQAFKHSNDLSDQVRKAFKIKKQAVEDGKIKGFSRKHIPGWISPETVLDARDRAVIKGYHFHPVKGAIVAGICKDHLEGVGVGEIARRLHKAGVPTLVEGLRKGKKRQWAQSLVYRLLRNYQLIGNQKIDGQGKKDFYPSVISEEMFLKIQAKLDANKEKHGYSTRPTDSVNNIFSGVAFCSCGQAIKVLRNSRGYKYISCYGRLKGDCAIQNSPRYNLLEDSFVSPLKNNAEKLIQDETGNQAAHNVAALEKEIQNLRETADEMLKLGQKTIQIQIQINERDEQITDTKKQIALESAKGASVKGGTDALNKIIAKLDTLGTDKAYRAHINGWIRQNVEKVTVNREGEQAVFLLKNGFELQIDLESGEYVFGGQKIQVLHGADWETMTAAHVKLA